MARAHETRRFEMLKRVREFGEAHRDLFPASGLGSQAFEAVAEAVTRLSDQDVSKMVAAREGTHAKATARRALTRRLEAISRSARVIAGEAPGFDVPFRLPRPRTDQALLTTGRVFARDAEAVRDRFIANGMAGTFVTDLRVLVDAFEEAIRSRQAGKDGHTHARASIEAALTSGFAAVRKLDVIVANQLEDDPVTMAVWERDRRVEHSHRPRKVTSRPPIPPALAPPAALET